MLLWMPKGRAGTKGRRNLVYKEKETLTEKELIMVGTMHAVDCSFPTSDGSRQQGGLWSSHAQQFASQHSIDAAQLLAHPLRQYMCYRAQEFNPRNILAMLRCHCAVQEAGLRTMRSTTRVGASF